MDTLEQLKSAVSCGDYLAAWLSELPEGLSPAEYEWLARLKLEQGDFNAARHMLERASLVAADPSEKQLFRMQLIGLEAQSTGDVAQARAHAGALMTSGISDSIVLRVLFLRVELLAGMTWMIPPQAARSELQSLIPDLAVVSPYRAATAERWLAATATTTSEVLACAERSAHFARLAGFPHLGADTWIVAAQKARNALRPISTILQALEHAQKGFEATRHRPGLLAVARERLLVRLLTGEAAPEELAVLCNEAERLGATALSYSIEIDLATHLRDRGRVSEARKHEAKSAELATTSGMGNLFKGATGRKFSNGTAVVQSPAFGCRRSR
ncbi:hypothetical protein [Tritonibacter horizontis]|uniref:Tetratricopeptide repeat protein n=1 Tax=Tritonibacter horizontis TaxID=1768241 RepID=A0A132C1X6_9RHOB|nr:hypothetical protein [Tritonibacter horizontis]KUP94621.1 hypothetical protein TRIHO_05470 [Tritonibacter horizontis]